MLSWLKDQVMGYEPNERTPLSCVYPYMLPRGEGSPPFPPHKGGIYPPLPTQQASVSKEVVVPRREVYKTAKVRSA